MSILFFFPCICSDSESNTVTLTPLLANFDAMLEPIKPAPPVIRTFLNVSFMLISIFTFSYYPWKVVVDELNDRNKNDNNK